jgi:mono/diheme cytochrome c family protein
MIALLQTHVLVVVLFLLLYTTKLLLLVLNKQDALTRAKKYTRVLDIIFGVLTLVTGSWLLLSWNGPVPAYLIVKVLLVVIAIPLGSMGLKKNSKLLALLALLLFAYVYGIAVTDNVMLQAYPGSESATALPPTPETDAVETGDSLNTDEETTEEEIIASMGESALTNAKSIYVQVCANCHGEDGSKQLAGAPDLTVSSLNHYERKNIIENGRGLMPAFGHQLTEQETEELAAYTIMLKTN